MNNSLISSVISLVKDGQLHELYELNQTYRFSYSQAKDTVKSLSKIGVLYSEYEKFSLNKSLSKKQISELYALIRYRTLRLEEDKIEQFENDAIKVNCLYVPNISRLDSALLIDVNKK